MFEKKLSVKLKWKLSREMLILVNHLRTVSRIKLQIFQLNKGNKQTDSWTKTFRLYRSTCIKWINFFLSCGDFFFWYLIWTRLHFPTQPGLLSREQEALRQLSLTSFHYAAVVLSFVSFLLLLPRSIWRRNRQKNHKTNILSKLHLQPKRGWVREK